MQTINAIINRLKDEGNLDEEAVQRFKKADKKFRKWIKFSSIFILLVSFASLFQDGPLTSLYLIFSGLLVYYLLCTPIIKNRLITVNLYSFGLVANGIIESCTVVTFPRYINSGYDIVYNFKHQGKKIKISRVVGKLDVPTQNLKKIKKVKVLYDEHNPSQSTIFDTQAKKEFCFNKNRSFTTPTELTEKTSTCVGNFSLNSA